jgi:hypothetical protein
MGSFNPSSKNLQGAVEARIEGGGSGGWLQRRRGGASIVRRHGEGAAESVHGRQEALEGGTEGGITWGGEGGCAETKDIKMFFT